MHHMLIRLPAPLHNSTEQLLSGDKGKIMADLHVGMTRTLCMAYQ